MSNSKGNRSNLEKLALAAVFCALALGSVFVFRIKVAFLTFDAKDAVIVLCSLLLCPVYGAWVAPQLFSGLHVGKSLSGYHKERSVYRKQYKHP